MIRWEGSGWVVENNEFKNAGEDADGDHARIVGIVPAWSVRSLPHDVIEITLPVRTGGGGCTRCPSKPWGKNFCLGAIREHYLKFKYDFEEGTDGWYPEGKNEDLVDLPPIVPSEQVDNTNAFKNTVRDNQGIAKRCPLTLFVDFCPEESKPKLEGSPDEVVLSRARRDRFWHFFIILMINYHWSQDTLRL